MITLYLLYFRLFWCVSNCCCTMFLSSVLDLIELMLNGVAASNQIFNMSYGL